MGQDIFEKALSKARENAFADLTKQGYKEMHHNGGSHFYTLNQEGKSKLALMFSVFIEPNIETEYEIRERDIQELADLVKGNYNVLCYHYKFDDELIRNKPIIKQVVYPSDIVEFLEKNSVTVKSKIK